MKFIAPCLAVLFLSGGIGGIGVRATAADADTLDQGPAPAIAELKQFAAAYNEAMAHKNKTALLNFYYNSQTPVTGVVSPASFALMTKASQGKAPQIMQYDAETASAGDTAAKSTTEKMTHLTAQTDGSVASIQYDYAIPQGHGHTFWTLARGKEGWKITSIVYSINLAALDHASSN